MVKVAVSNRVCTTFHYQDFALAKIKKQQSVVKESKAGKAALTAEDLINSEYFWYQRIQEETYPDEFEHLRNGEPISKNSRILKLDQFFDKDYRYRSSCRRQITMFSTSRGNKASTYSPTGPHSCGKNY